MADYPQKRNRTSMVKGGYAKNVLRDERTLNEERQEEQEVGQGDLQREVIKLNLGSGPHKKDGYVNIDSCEECDPDLWLNLEKAKLPYEDGSVEEIIASHVLEHISKLIPLMNECNRVLKPGGYMKINVPVYPSIQAFQDPTHIRFFTDATFQYFVGSNFFWQDVGKYYGISPWSWMKQDVRNGWELVVILQK